MAFIVRKASPNVRRAGVISNYLYTNIARFSSVTEHALDSYSPGAQVIAPPTSLNHERLRSSTLKGTTLVTSASTEAKLPLQCFKPSPASSMCQPFFFGYAMFYKDSKIDAENLKKSVQRLVTELPVLAGRVKPSNKLPGLKPLGELELECNNAGAEFTTAQSNEHTIKDLGPHTWTAGFSGQTLTSFKNPFYTDPIDMNAMMKGKEPVFKVKLTHCKDGSIVSFTIAHVLTDGGRAVKIGQRLAELYRRENSKDSPTPLSPPLHFNPELETPEGFTKAIENTTSKLVENSSKKQEKEEAEDQDYRLSLRQKLAAPYRLHKHVTAKYDVHNIHIPKSAMQEIKKLASGGGSTVLQGKKVDPISTMDAVQAFIMTIMSDVRGLPLVPTFPSEMTVNVDLLRKDIPFKDPKMVEGHLGNAVHILHVPGIKPGSAEIPTYDIQTDNDDKIKSMLITALQMNARLIRNNMSTFKSILNNVVKALQWQITLSSLPEAQTAAAFVVKAAEQKHASTTAVTSFPYASIDFGSGPPTYFQINTLPLFDWWTIIQPAMPPDDGVLCGMVLGHGLQTKLVMHPAWRLLIPHQATLYVADKTAEDLRKCAEARERSETDKTLEYEGYHHASQAASG